MSRSRCAPPHSTGVPAVPQAQRTAASADEWRRGGPRSAHPLGTDAANIDHHLGSRRGPSASAARAPIGNRLNRQPMRPWVRICILFLSGVVELFLLSREPVQQGCTRSAASRWVYGRRVSWSGSCALTPLATREVGGSRARPPLPAQRSSPPSAPCPWARAHGLQP